MNRISTSGEKVLGLDRRKAARSPGHDQIVIRQTIDDGDCTRHSGWSFNRSESGISFRCREKLTESIEIELDPESVVEARIIWNEEVMDGVWEYGAAIGPAAEQGEDIVLRLTGDEIKQLVSIPVENPREDRKQELESMRVLSKAVTTKALDDHYTALQRRAIYRAVAVVGISSAGTALAMTGVIPAALDVPFLAIAAIGLAELWRKVSNR